MSEVAPMRGKRSAKHSGMCLVCQQHYQAPTRAYEKRLWRKEETAEVARQHALPNPTVED